jgi:DNA polymerase I
MGYGEKDLCLSIGQEGSTVHKRFLLEHCPKYVGVFRGLQTLDQFVSPASGQKSKPASSELVELRSRAAPREIPPSYFVSIGYDGQKRSCYVRLYEPKSHRLYDWYDVSAHRPYCFSDKPKHELESIDAISKNPGFERFDSVEKYDALRCKQATRTMIVAKDPLTIGGKPVGSIRDVIRAWEADIKYVENYIYDNRLEPGMMYEVREGALKRIEYSLDKEATVQVAQLLRKESDEYRELALEWMRLLECPVPTYLRAAIDIEVFSPVINRIPDAEIADQEVICASLVGSDGKARVFLLTKDGKKQGTTPYPPNASVELYETERALLAEFFKATVVYPVILTFNGDDFDLRYLFHRALNLGFAKEEIPIEMGRDVGYLRNGVHIDLYKFFFNRSIQIYAFGQKYRENTLGEVSEAILGRGKIDTSAPVSELDYGELAVYCLNDSEITLELTRIDDELVMKLITALSRISYMSLEDVSRQGVSSWIRSIMYCHHRKRNYFIPRADEIEELKGGTTTEAIIKGKKYKGAIVVEPRPGVHFDVAVLDFASLYPSIIRNWNLGYETVRCPHTDEECRKNLVPGTSHWVCKKARALESLLIGSLRDIRVNWYKPRSRDGSLSKNQQSWYKVVADALKVVLNASYGVFGADRFALYCPPVAEATAAIGRYAISQTLEKARELGIEVLYGDTDSLFLESPDPSALKSLVEWSKSSLRMELEVDKNYRYLALSSRKKNYLGVKPDGSVDIKGLTGKKRHIPEFLTKAFYDMVRILSDVENRDEFESAKVRITEIVKECYLKLRNREYTLDELAFSVMMGRDTGSYKKTTPQHVKAAKQLEGTGVEVKSGELIAFVKVIGEQGVKPVQLAKIDDIDIQKYMEYLRSTFEQVLDSLGIEFEDLVGVKKLESFFSSAK